MRIAGADLLPMTLCLLGVGCSRPQATVPEASGRALAYKLLASFPADPASALTYQLVIDSCKSDGCPVTVQLVKHERLLDSAKLGWEAATQETSLEDLDAEWGASDPLGADPPSKAWATGEEANYVSTAARTVRITTERIGLLVTQRAGWEHVKHRHDLFMNDGTKILGVWSAEDGAGPAWSSIDAIPESEKTDQILYHSGFQQPAADKPDDFGVARVAWDDRQQKVVQTPIERGDPLRLATFGEYSSIARAAAARQQASDCLALMLWVLDARAYGGSAGKYFLGTITARPEMMTKVSEAGKQCSPPLKGSIKRF